MRTTPFWFVLQKAALFRRSLPVIPMALALLFGGIDFSDAAAVNWNNASQAVDPLQDWAVDTNWVGGAVSANADDVILNNGGVIVVSTAVTSSSIQVGSSAGGGLHVKSGGSYTALSGLGLLMVFRRRRG